MEKRLANNVSAGSQWAIILVTNLFFVWKYVPRAGISPILATIVYSIFFIGCVYLYKHAIKKNISEVLAGVFSIIITVGIICFIVCAIIFISPYSIQVDRWSATSFFIEALLNGEYPYGVHTHISENNFPSPFPFWHYINIPFWLMGDVGWIQLFFLLFFLASMYVYFRSWHAVLGSLLLLCISPAYWWELVTRSDGLSNAILVCSSLLLIERYNIKMKDKWWFMAIITGCLASTRLSAIIPMALYLFKPWLDANWKVKIGFVGIVFAIIFAFFAPYIFWDTETWIFFQRNPFMSQTSPGSPWILGVMVFIALIIAYKKQTFYYYLSTTSIFIFTFMLVSQIGVILLSPTPVTLFDSCCDISYFTLALPYVILALVLHDKSTPLLVS